MEQVELIHRCQQGDRQAMGLLYTDMHDELLDICRHYVNDSATAEDLLHDSFLLIFRWFLITLLGRKRMGFEMGCQRANHSREIRSAVVPCGESPGIYPEDGEV